MKYCSVLLAALGGLGGHWADLMFVLKQLRRKILFKESRNSGHVIQNCVSVPLTFAPFSLEKMKENLVAAAAAAAAAATTSFFVEIMHLINHCATAAVNKLMVAWQSNL